MAVVITRGQTFGALEQITNTKLHNLVDLATIAGLTTSDIATGTTITDTKLATIATAGKVNTSALVTTSSAAGDILYGNGTGYVRLAVGTAGQYLKVKAGATELEWGA